MIRPSREEWLQVALNGLAWGGLLPTLRERWLHPYHGDWPPEREAESALNQAACLLQSCEAAGLSFRSRRVLEIGTGASLCLSALLIGLGAREVVTIDRRRLLRRGVRVARAYQHLAASLPDWIPAKEVAGALLRKLASDGDAQDQLRYVPGVDIHRDDPPGRFDLVVSYAVLEHLRDPATAIRRMTGLLASGGAQVHWVDLADHLWVAEPLRFLCYPRDWFERMTGFRSTYCNRFRLHDFLRCIAESGLEVRHTRVTREADPAYLAALRPSLAPGFAEMTDAELTPLAFVVAAGAPGEAE